MAAAAAVVVVCGLALVLRPADRPQTVTADGPDRDATTSVTPTTPRRLDLAAVRTACERFGAAAFAPATRAQVVAAANAAHLATPDDALEAARRLAEATAALRDDLAAAGALGPETSTPMSRLQRELREATRSAEAGDLDRTHRTLRLADGLLQHIGASLVQVGVPQCT